MGKLKTNRVSFDGIEKNELVFSYDVNVDSDGCFTTTLPDEIVLKLKKCGVQLKRNRLGREGYFNENTLDKLENEISKTIKNMLSKEVESTKIILKYSINTACAYFKDLNGDFWPNGAMLNTNWSDKDTPEEREAKTWKGGTRSQSASNPKPYSIDVYVMPVVRTTYIYKDGRKQEIDERVFNGKEYGDNMNWINNIVSQTIPKDSVIKEIEYTEERALFFKNLFIGMFKLNEIFKQFVEPESIDKIIQGGNFNLLK